MVINQFNAEDIKIYKQSCHGSNIVNIYESTIHIGINKSKRDITEIINTFEGIKLSIKHHQLFSEFGNSLEEEIHKYTSVGDHEMIVNNSKNHLFAIINVDLALNDDFNKIEACYKITFKFIDKEYESRYQDLGIKTILCCCSPNHIIPSKRLFAYFDVYSKDNDNIDKK